MEWWQITIQIITAVGVLLLIFKDFYWSKRQKETKNAHIDMLKDEIAKWKALSPEKLWEVQEALQKSYGEKFKEQDNKIIALTKERDDVKAKVTDLQIEIERVEENYEISISEDVPEPVEIDFGPIKQIRENLSKLSSFTALDEVKSSQQIFAEYIKRFQENYRSPLLEIFEKFQERFKEAKVYEKLVPPRFDETDNDKKEEKDDNKDADKNDK